MFKKIWMAAALLSWGGVSAQDVTPPTFNGADRRFFKSRLQACVKELAVEERVRVDSLSSEAAIVFMVDTAGNVQHWRFADRTSPGRDSVDLAPATPRTQTLIRDAFLRIEGVWQPAEQDGRKVPYTVRTRIRLPLRDIDQAVNPDPLLFLGHAPDESFYPWLRKRVRYDDRFAKVGGKVRIRFWIEADGAITIDEVIKAPDERLAREVIRVIRNSAGKWTPRKVDGKPVRTTYEIAVNYINEGH